jgi:pyruvate/2-oxoglutarate dehydrogenase complex dihydrolipoamide acyltransferase (E2) component
MSIAVTLEAKAWEGVDSSAQALVDSWLVQEGARVEAGQPLARIVLVKSTLDVVAPTAGVVERILVPAGENFAQGQPLASMRAA